MNFTIPLYRENVHKLPEISQKPEHSHAWYLDFTPKLQHNIIGKYNTAYNKAHTYKKTCQYLRLIHIYSVQYKHLFLIFVLVIIV